MADLTLPALAGSPDDLLAQLADDPEFRKLAFPGVGNVTERLVVIAQLNAMTKLGGLVEPVLRARYASFVERNGARPATAPASDEWDSALDDEVANVLESYAEHLSADWLGNHTVDTRLHLDNELERLVQSFSKEMWKQLTFSRGDKDHPGRPKTTAQIASALGFGTDAITAFLATRTSKQQQPQTELIPNMSMNTVLNKIMLLGVFAADTLAGDLKIVVDDEDFLAQQAAQRLGIDMDDVETLRTATLSGYEPDSMAALVTAGAALDEGDDAEDGKAAEPVPLDEAATGDPVDNIALPGEGDDAKDVSPASPPPPPPAVAESPLPPPAKGRKPRAPAEPVAGAIPASVLQTVRDNANVKDEDAATLLGFSRATYNNYVKGKGQFVPSDDQRNALIGLVRGKANALIGVLTALTGEPHDEV